MAFSLRQFLLVATGALGIAVAQPAVAAEPTLP
ncbi:hypothetical protein BN961_00722 [Afipia felis]|uniref:Uncharacterized protein n=1 Tax=Afipia felis TaxID=1035 RepID=A0A090N6R9_AFIFE|nr:hypothetical protein BN961_00722 [Afipia felis]